MVIDESSSGIEVFRGTQGGSAEYGLVLDAKGLGYECLEADGAWVLVVAAAVADVARDELMRYAAERRERRERPPPFVPHAGSGLGAGVYALVLILVAHSAGLGLFGVDWLAAGAIESHPGSWSEGWRAVTALTLHLDQEHLLGNLLFGVGIGILAGRMFGPGVAWLGIVLAGAIANYVDMLVSPSGHRAVGASTAVFAALGLLAGFGWGRPLAWHALSQRAGRLYRWAPLFGGVCLLALLGAGGPPEGLASHVDVLGHVLGFAVGVMLGWARSRCFGPRSPEADRRTPARQWVAGSLAALVVGAAWVIALRHS